MMISTTTTNRALIRVVSAVLFALVWWGCVDGCTAAVPEGYSGAEELSEAVPADAVQVIYAKRLDELLHGLGAVVDAAPREFGAPLTAGEWSETGAALDAPAAAFWRDDQWAVIAWVDPEADASIELSETDAHRRASEPGSWWQFSTEGWREYEEDDRMTRWASTDGRRVAVGWALSEFAEPLDEQIWELGDNHWSEPISYQWERDDAVDLPVVVGVGEGAKLVDSVMYRFAAFDPVRDQVAEQLETVRWTLHEGDDSNHRVVRLQTAGTEERGWFSRFGHAGADLPPLGSLLGDKPVGAVRLSGDPQRVVDLVVEQLDGDQKMAVDSLLEFLSGELSIDIEGDFLGNLTGHVAVAVFDLEEEFVEREGMDWFVSLTSLEATRQAVVVPFEERESMVLVLDALTQISQGAFQRQGGDDVIRYVMFDDGELMWLVFVDDEHLVFVDNILASDRVRRWQSDAGEFDDRLVDRGVDEMLGQRTGVGLYMDADRLREELDDEIPDALRWIEPVEAVRIRTDVGGRSDLTEIDVWLVEDSEDTEQ